MLGRLPAHAALVRSERGRTQGHPPRGGQRPSTTLTWLLTKNYAIFITYLRSEIRKRLVMMGHLLAPRLETCCRSSHLLIIFTTNVFEQSDFILCNARD